MSIDNEPKEQESTGGSVSDAQAETPTPQHLSHASGATSDNVGCATYPQPQNVRTQKDLREYVEGLKRPSVATPTLTPQKYTPNRVNWETVKGAIVQGASPKEAMVLGGSNAKHPTHLLRQKLRNDPDYASSLSRKLTTKINLALNSITKDKLGKESAAKNAVVLDILIKNKRLLDDQSTTNVAVTGQFNVTNMSKEEVVRAYRDFVHG